MKLKLKPRLASSVIALLPWFSLLALAGCQPVASDGGAMVFRAAKDQVQLGLDVDDRRSDLALISGTKSVNIGDDPVDSFTGGFRKQEKALRLNRLPIGFDDTFIADGWELGDRSVGLISRNHNVLIMVDSRENVSQQDIDREVSQYKHTEKAMTQVTNLQSRYYFWEQNGIRLMVCSTLDATGRLSVTAAVGVDQLMDRFHMDPHSAAIDGGKADQMIKPASRGNSAG